MMYVNSCEDVIGVTKSDLMDSGAYTDFYGTIIKECFSFCNYREQGLNRVANGAENIKSIRCASLLSFRVVLLMSFPIAEAMRENSLLGDDLSFWRSRCLCSTPREAER
jgi:hypothetical protein